MLKKYNKLWVFGDSYTTPDFCVTPSNSFWGLSASHLDIPEIINCSWPGNSFTSVLHMLISMQSQYNFKNDYFIIGIPPIERLTVFDNFKDTQYTATCIDANSWLTVDKPKINCHTGLQILTGAKSQQMVLYEDRAWTETHVLTSIFLVTSWLDSVDANYLIVNLSKPLDPNNVWGPSEFVLPYAKSHKRCILFDNTYYSSNIHKNKPADYNLYGWMGHHGPDGNKHFFEVSVKDKL